MDYIDNILGQYGFGESVSLGGKTTRVNTDIEPDHQAYAECYAHALRDEVMMENEKLAMHIEVAKIRAAGEDLKEMTDKVKDKVKEGKDKIKKFLLELYDKVIRFFTETLRYFFSNEKRSGKLIAELKAAVKKSAKTGDGTVKVFDVSSIEKKMASGESYIAYGEKSKSPEGALLRTEESKYAKSLGGVSKKNRDAKFYEGLRDKLEDDSQKLLSKTPDPDPHGEKYTTYRTVIGWVNGKIENLLQAVAKKITGKAQEIAETTESKPVTQTTETSAPVDNPVEDAKELKQNLEERANAYRAALKSSKSNNSDNKDLEILSALQALGFINVTIGAVKLLPNATEDDNEVRDKATTMIELVKEAYDEQDGIFKDILDGVNSNKVDMKYSEAHDLLKGWLQFAIELLEAKRKGNDNMKGLNKKIRKFTEEKRKLEKSIKEANKEDNEEEGKILQKKRMALVYCIKTTNLFKTREDRSLGLIMQIARIILNDFNKVSK